MALMGGERRRPRRRRRKPMEREFAMATVTVAGEDITGLIVTGARGAKARGRLVFEGGAKPENLASLRLMAAPTEPDNMAQRASAFGMAAVKETGTFEIDGLVGGRTFRFIEPAEGLVPQAHHARERRHHRQGIRLQARRRGGRLRDRPDHPIADRVGHRHERQGGAGRRNTRSSCSPRTRRSGRRRPAAARGSARPDQQGQFRIASLPPAPTSRLPSSTSPRASGRDPEWLARAARKATRFTLDEGAAKTLGSEALAGV